MRRAIFTHRLNPTLELHVFPGFEDNYFYLIASQNSQSCVVVDPGGTTDLLRFIEKSGKSLEAILLTHHHRDHTGGVSDLIKQFPKASILCSPWFKVPPTWEKCMVERVEPNDVFSVLETKFRVIDVRGHTLDHIAFAVCSSDQDNGVSDVFVGDSVFGAGCGGLFEGTHEQMLEGLRRIKSLSPETRLWCAHEYTLKNLRVARLLKEDNPTQIERLLGLESHLQKYQLEPHQLVTLPLTVGEEVSTNPFFRCDTEELQKTIDTTDELATFKKVRAFRDQF